MTEGKPMNDKATRDKIAAAKVSLFDLGRAGQYAQDSIRQFENLARECLPEILAVLPADIDPDTSAALVRLRLEAANNQPMTIETIQAFLSVYEALCASMPPYPQRSKAAIKRAEKRNFKRQHRGVMP